ncbi:MAG: hypothetical protein COT81_01785 [Candidatus Buchananbacteria bacterium CG10_big_fil_rev_8_21_14_0_10_42_9]|uniref:Uncharacterized protein n=1 Tax=Candidatus Buchananbacteria bacterium CG10_big_fil_rev_8_21_14_0_10_42_9 TaxID=1974526 RepID=A0A2H0W1U4_9BACT|nr:MAG: hypothetical protein COT81_01785 [Candidatus Buchananbacteria bacterium CG10_big_fil_rev_8_21_14_0_10_42_9]
MSKRSPIETLPYAVRKKILTLIVGGLMIIIFIVWIITLPNQFDKTGSKTNEHNSKKELENLWQQAKNGLDLTKEQFADVPQILESLSTTTTDNIATETDKTNLTPQQIEIIKKSILQQTNSSTATSTIPKIVHQAE